MYSEDYVSCKSIALISGGLLTLTLCFLTEETAHHLSRATAVVLMFLAMACAGAGFIGEERRSGYTSWLWLRRIAIALLSTALLAATAGYVVSASERGEMRQHGLTEDATTDSTVTDTMATDTMATDTMATDTMATDTMATDTITTNTMTTETVATNTMATDSTATDGTTTTTTSTQITPNGDGLPNVVESTVETGTLRASHVSTLNPPKGGVLWLGISVFFGICALLAFTVSLGIGPVPAVRWFRVAGVTLGTASIVASGWKLFEFDSFIKNLDIEMTWASKSKVVKPPKAREFSVLLSRSIGAFAPGEAALDRNLKADLNAAREAAERNGNVVLAVVVGHADKRSLSPAAAQKYTSNQGLALQRALAVQLELNGISTIVSVGGPSHTYGRVTPNQLAHDRRVDVCFLGRR